MTQIYEEKIDCCGCTACQSVCPKNAITFKPDEEGFLYPAIDQTLCVDCGLCAKTCDLKVFRSFDQPHHAFYGVKSNDSVARAHSQSGGIYRLLADFTLKKSGVIYGVTFRDKKAVYERATTEEEAYRFSGSKYVQAFLGDTFPQVKNDLENGIFVLFTGTSCYVAGLNGYLGKKYDNLLTMDFVCHGVPSPKLLYDYLAHMETLYHEPVRSFDFRNKTIAWKTDIGTVYFNNKTIDSYHYSRLFYSHNALRPACYYCNYAKLNKPADITIGDFWGIDSINPSFNDREGVSAVILHTALGLSVFHSIEPHMSFFPTDYTSVSKFNRNLYRSTAAPATRWQFWQDYQKKGIAYLLRHYGGNNFYTKLKRFVKKCLLLLRIKKDVA